MFFGAFAGLALAYSEMRSVLSTGIKLPDAMFCANDEMAWGCIKAFQELSAHSIAGAQGIMRSVQG